MGLLDSRVGLVTGAGSGIGRVTAQVFAREGAKVVVADWNEERALETAATSEEEGMEATAVHVACSYEEGGAAMCRRAVERRGHTR